MAEGRKSGKAEGPEAAAACEDEPSGEAKLGARAGGGKAVGQVGEVTGRESKAMGRHWLQERAVG